ncbi:MAG TPA: hypothetical protein DEP36_05990 [Gammaproteobacteria bacterium]|nr:hypothetical protein [Gammaproteobacteria bacterium]
MDGGDASQFQNQGGERAGNPIERDRPAFMELVRPAKVRHRMGNRLLAATIVVKAYYLAHKAHNLF